MVGVVIAGHGQMAEALVQAAEGIVGKLPQLAVVNLLPEEGLEGGRVRISEAVKQVDTGEGAVVLVDMFGGTPSNCCLFQLDARPLEVVTGVNLPMILKLATARTDGVSPRQLADALVAHGQRNVLLASELLRARLGLAG